MGRWLRNPRIVESANGTYYLTYTAYDGDKARLMIATSSDLYHWAKQGHVFGTAFNKKYVNEWSKSGSIVCKYENGKADRGKNKRQVLDVLGRYKYFSCLFI